MDINKICFDELGGSKSIQYSLPIGTCVNDGVTVEAPDWIEVSERTEDNIFDLNVDEGTEVKFGHLKFYLNGNLCYDNIC